MSFPYAPSPGGHGVPGKSCFRCGRALFPEERRKQDGVTVCPYCEHDHSKRDYDHQVSREWSEYKEPIVIGGRTG